MIRFFFKYARSINISRQVIVRVVKQEYQVSSWAGFLKLCGVELTPQSLSTIKDVNEFKELGGESLNAYWKFIIASYIIKGYTLVDIAKLPDVKYDSGLLSWKVRKWWGSLDNARRLLIAPIFALCLKLGYNDKQIRNAMPFFQDVKDYKRKIYRWCNNWFFINPIQARFFLESMSLNEFFSRYLQ